MKLNLPTMAQVNSTRRAVPKGQIPTVKSVKAKAGRSEKKVKVDVRAKCVLRDGDCRIAKAGMGDEIAGVVGNCDGPPEWAHLEDKRRSKTRGQAPEVRHTTEDSLILCRRHHNRYDGHERPRIGIDKRTKRGADGPLRFKEKTEK